MTNPGPPAGKSEPPPDGGYRYPWDDMGFVSDFLGVPIKASSLIPPNSVILVNPPSGKLPSSPAKVTAPKRTVRQRAQDAIWVLATVAMVLATMFLGLLLAVWAHWVILFWW